ncbi:MAG: hypothetical protein LUF34_11105, partial [Lachnospiraceae bacterium]|nr:hypothetical protein [Lachnospiraceae bacterium]
MFKGKRFLNKGCACALICILALSGCAGSSSTDASNEAESSLAESAEEPGSRPDGESMPEGETPPDGEGMEEGGTPPDGESMAEGETPPDGEGGGPGGEDGGQGGPGGEGGSTQAEQPESFDAVTEYAEDATVESESYSSTGTDENAILISGGTVTLSDITVDRTSSDSTGGDSSSFYGVGAAILATDGILNVLNSVITTDASGGAGIFAYGNSVVNVEDTTITTTQDTSGGIHVAGGGTLSASNLTVSTAGASAAAIRSDRGGGTMTVDGGTYTSSGTGSPAVYCTADITVSNATLTAIGSEALCMEGLNYLSLTDCDITGNMSDDDQNDTTWNVIVYQSMSGDSEEGVSTLRISGGTLTANNGGMIYTTNTE